MLLKVTDFKIMTLNNHEADNYQVLGSRSIDCGNFSNSRVFLLEDILNF
jgi:hypothetical protein